MDPVTLGIIGSGVATAGINAISTHVANRQNIKAQKEVNAQQLAYQKNAYSYAAADRLRAGLSPLDTQAASSPSLGAPTVSPVDVGPLADSVVSAISSAQRQQEIDTSRGLANAQVANLSADTDSKLIDNLTRAQDNYVKLLERYESLEKTHNENTVFMQNFQKEMDLAQATIKELQAKVTNLSSSTRVNNATAVEQEAQNNYSAGLRLPPSLLRSVSAQDAQSMFVYNGLLHAWQNRSKSDPSAGIDFPQAYRFYKEQAEKALSDAREAYNSAKAHNFLIRGSGRSQNGNKKYYTDRLKEAEKIMSYKEFLKRAQGK